MNYLGLIKSLDNRTANDRLLTIIEHLKNLGVDFASHQYATGTNLIVELGKSHRRIGVSSHFDTVKGAGGANDNGAAIAVCFDIIRKHQKLNNLDFGLRVLFLMKKENGLLGSTAYIKDHSIKI